MRTIRRLLTTARGTVILNSIATVIGIALIALVHSSRIGTIVFLAVTALESGMFSLLYGLRSSWRKEPAARALFWAVLAYFGMAFHLLTLFIVHKRWGWWWADGLRELLYLGLAIAGLNLCLTAARLLRPVRYRGDGE